MMADERRTTPLTWIALFILVLVVTGGLVLFLTSERAVEIQRTEGEGVLQERAERQEEAPEMADPGETPPPAPGETAPDDDQYGVTRDGRLLVDEWLWISEGDETLIRGSIENLTEEPLGPVVLVFELQDGAGREVGSAEGEIFELRGGRSHQYEIPVENPQAVQARLLEVIIGEAEAAGDE